MVGRLENSEQSSCQKNCTKWKTGSEVLKDNKTLNVQDLEEEENLWKRTLLLRPFTLSRTAEENLRYEAPEVKRSLFTNSQG